MTIKSKVFAYGRHELTEVTEYIEKSLNSFLETNKIGEKEIVSVTQSQGETSTLLIVILYRE